MIGRPKKVNLQVVRELCSMCICLPVCVNKIVHLLITQCAIIEDELRAVANYNIKDSNRITVEFIGIGYINLEIYSDTIYVLDVDNQSALSAVRRNKRRYPYVHQVL